MCNVPHPGLSAGRLTGLLLLLGLAAPVWGQEATAWPAVGFHPAQAQAVAVLVRVSPELQALGPVLIHEQPMLNQLATMEPIRALPASLRRDLLRDSRRFLHVEAREPYAAGVIVIYVSNTPQARDAQAIARAVADLLRGWTLDEALQGSPADGPEQVRYRQLQARLGEVETQIAGLEAGPRSVDQRRNAQLQAQMEQYRRLARQISEVSDVVADLRAQLTEAEQAEAQRRMHRLPAIAAAIDADAQIIRLREQQAQMEQELERLRTPQAGVQPPANQAQLLEMRLENLRRQIETRSEQVAVEAGRELIPNLRRTLRELNGRLSEFEEAARQIVEPLRGAERALATLAGLHGEADYLRAQLGVAPTPSTGPAILGVFVR